MHVTQDHAAASPLPIPPTAHHQAVLQAQRSLLHLELMQTLESEAHVQQSLKKTGTPALLLQVSQDGYELSLCRGPLTTGII